ncbi:MAG: adventurous gliding motility protein GltJ, partial [Thermoleophilaceae bacterium]
DQPSSAPPAPGAAAYADPAPPSTNAPASGSESAPPADPAPAGAAPPAHQDEEPERTSDGGDDANKTPDPFRPLQ